MTVGLHDRLELMQRAGLADISQVRITGGGARSPLWRQILADVLRAELVIVNTVEGAAYGAALLAATGTGAVSDVASACAAAIQPAGSAPPGPASAADQELSPLYDELYPALRSSFQAIDRTESQGSP